MTAGRHHSHAGAGARSLERMPEPVMRRCFQRLPCSRRRAVRGSSHGRAACRHTVPLMPLEDARRLIRGSSCRNLGPVCTPPFRRGACPRVAENLGKRKSRLAENSSNVSIARNNHPCHPPYAPNSSVSRQTARSKLPSGHHLFRAHMPSLPGTMRVPDHQTNAIVRRMGERR